MQPARSINPLSPLTCLDEIEQLVRRSLRGNWIIRVEHGTTESNWQSWGKPLFAVRDAESVTESILACRAAYPAHAIRLSAECFRPPTRLVYQVQHPQIDAGDEAQGQTSLPPSVPGAAAAAQVQHGGRVAGGGLWRVAALAGMLLASLLLIQESVFAAVQILP